MIDQQPHDVELVATLLKRWQQGDRAAFEELFLTFNQALRNIAHFKLKQERGGHLLQTTALINELFLKWVKGTPVPAACTATFKRFAARGMSQILIDHARRRDRQPPLCTPNDDFEPSTATPKVSINDYLAKNQAMARLVEARPDDAYIAVCRLELDMTIQEIAEHYQVPKSTVDRHWQICKTFLTKTLTR